MEGQPCRLGWGLCWLPVMVIRCVLEPAGKIRSFPGSHCKWRTPCGLPADLCSPAGEGEGNIRMWGIQRRLAGSARQRCQAWPGKPLCVLSFLTGIHCTRGCSGVLLQVLAAASSMCFFLFCSPAHCSVLLPICGFSLRPAAVLLFVSHFGDREAMWH